jgi:hypothetical protein
MNWLEIVGAIGGTAGIVALIKAGIDLYNARSNRNTVDISNMEKMLKDSMEREDKLETKFDRFQEESHKYVVELRGQIASCKGQINALENRLNNFEKVVNTAWRCNFPPKIEDCPVIKEYEKRHLCEDCEHHIKEK